MFSLLSAIIYCTGGVLLFLVLFVVWFWLPFKDPDIPLDLSPGVSLFFGNEEPTGFVRQFILLSRATTALIICTYVFLPALTFLVSFDHRLYSNTIALLLGGATIFFFFAALLYEFAYHR